MKKLTLMVSIYNSGDWIASRLNNILESTVINNIEVWCVNANSPDERDHTIPLDYSQKHELIKYERLDTRLSVYETWNYIINKSDGTYIANANTDDIVSPRCYETLMAMLDNGGPEHGLAYCSWFTTSKPSQNWNNLTAASPDGKPGHYAGNIETAGVGHFPLWRRSLHNEIGLFDTSFQALADADWWARIYYIAKKKLTWINQDLGAYLWRGGNNLWHQKVNNDEWRRYHQKVMKYKKGELE